MNQLIALSMEVGFATRTWDESIRYVQAQQEMVHQAIADALAQLHPDGFDIAMTLIDASKSLVTRDLLFRRRSAGPSDRIIFAMSRPGMVDQFVAASPETALCNFYLSPGGDLWVLIAQNLGPNRQVGKAAFQITQGSASAAFQARLDNYVGRAPGETPDFQLQRQLLEPIGAFIIPFFAQYGVPRRLVLISHRGLHALPLHAMFVATETGDLYLDGLVRETIYASCITELLYGNAFLPGPEGEEPPSDARMLVALDVAASGLHWISTEQEFWRSHQVIGRAVDIVTTAEQLPGNLAQYITINLSGHAISDPTSWSASHVEFGGIQISARDVATAWTLAGRPVVTLSACETAVNPSMIHLLDEYCGLDRAFRIAGASVVCASLWPISDPVAALASMMLPTWILENDVSVPHALTIFQSNLRLGEWKAWMLSDEQLLDVAAVNPEAADTLRGVYGKLDRMDRDAFVSPAFWSVLRCYA
jgi:hypothetical protein